MDRDEMLRAFAALENEAVEYVLVGAAAMGVHGLIRATEDLEIFIRATRENVTRLRSAFRSVYGDDPSIDEITADDLLGEYPTVRYRGSGDENRGEHSDSGSDARRAVSNEEEHHSSARPSRRGDASANV